MAISRQPTVHSGGSAPRPGSPTGQPPTGQPPTGQPPTGQPPTGQPPAGQPAPGDQDARQAAMDLVHRFVDALNRRDWVAMQGLLGDSVQNGTWFGEDPVTPQAVTRLIAMYIEAAPDWQETPDEFLSIDTQTGWVTYLSTGRGTLQGPIMGREPKDQQVAVQQVQCVRIQNGKIVEYRQHKHGMFENPFDEVINAPANLQESRADQGGSIQTKAQLTQRQNLLNAFQAGALSAAELATSLAAIAEPARCQAILRETYRRCQKPALPNGIYCDIHSQNVDPVFLV